MDCAPGNTPLVNVDGIYAKLECVNPTGSVKDRIADYMIRKSEESGLLKPGDTIVEATSGNTGHSLAKYGRERGYRVIIVMPQNMTEERKHLIRSYGAELILCTDGNFLEAANIRDELVREHGYFTTDQFANPLNAECHYQTTGKEIIRQLNGKTINAFVAGVGTGGTLIGTGKALKEHDSNISLIAVEPEESAVMSGGSPGIHGIQGIGDGFIPDIVSDGNGGLNPSICDIVRIQTKEAIKAANYLCRKGYCVGISSGANFLAAREIRRECGRVVTIFPDGYTKYASQGLLENASCKHHYLCAKIR